MSAHPSLEAPDLVLDLQGQLVQLGDRIAYAVTVGRSGNLRVGRVVEIVWAHTKVDKHGGYEWPREVPTKLRVQVERSALGELYTDKPTLIEAGFRRFVKLP